MKKCNVKDTQLFKQINDAILKGNLSDIKRLANNEQTLKLCEGHTENTLLHLAIHNSRYDIIEWLLEQEKIDINASNNNHETALLLAILQDDVIIVEQLLQYGCDVTSSYAVYSTYLHCAVQKNPKFPKIGQLLIENGADINVVDSNGNTPLHIAVENKNLECVCMLLYYNADTEIQDRRGRTAFMKSLTCRDCSSVQLTLLEYVVDFDIVSDFDKTALLYALYKSNPIAHEILERGCDVNKGQIIGCKSLWFTLWQNDLSLFKIIYPKFDLTLLRECRSYPIILNYMTVCEFPKADWLECLYVLLTSSFAIEFIMNVNEFLKSSGVIDTLFYCFAKASRKKLIDKEQRIAIIYLLLSLGADVYKTDILITYAMYGFNEEFSIFLNFPFYKNETNWTSLDNPIVEFILDFTLFSTGEVYSILKQYCYLVLHSFDYSRRLLHVAQFFTLSQYYQLVQDSLPDDAGDIINQRINIPSLIELSRNQTLAAIALKFPQENSVFYHAYLKYLPIPVKIREILQFKIPIYNIIPPTTASNDTDEYEKYLFDLDSTGSSSPPSF